MPTENAVGLPVQSQVRGACLLPPWGMVFNQRGFVFFSRDWLEVGFPGDNMFWTSNQRALFKQVPPCGQDFSPNAKGTTPPRGPDRSLL